MTVAELIAKLSELPPDAEVVTVYDVDKGGVPVEVYVDTDGTVWL